jgi:hypothetical protein
MLAGGPGLNFIKGQRLYRRYRHGTLLKNLAATDNVWQYRKQLQTKQSEQDRNASKRLAAKDRAHEIGKWGWKDSEVGLFDIGSV